MYRSGKGFGLTGVAVAVALMILTAVFSSSANSADLCANTMSMEKQTAAQ